MDFIMELDRGKYFWPVVRGVGEYDEMKEEAKEPVGAYRGMSRGDLQERQWRWMDQDERWGQMETWMARHDQQ
ncbi:hypothetical protein Tco_0552386, partial [Tanacetum coccineum]